MHVGRRDCRRLSSSPPPSSVARAAIRWRLPAIRLRRLAAPVAPLSIVARRLLAVSRTAPISLACGSAAQGQCAQVLLVLLRLGTHTRRLRARPLLAPPVATARIRDAPAAIAPTTVAWPSPVAWPSAVAWPSSIAPSAVA